MTAPTKNNVTVGNWASVAGGRWHIPQCGENVFFRATVTALCGLTYEPSNICVNEAPPTNDAWICKHCVSRKATQ
jgi:hypothetical protein